MENPLLFIVCRIETQQEQEVNQVWIVARDESTRSPSRECRIQFKVGQEEVYEWWVGRRFRLTINPL